MRKIEDTKNKAPSPRVLACESRRLFGPCLAAKRRTENGGCSRGLHVSLCFENASFFGGIGLPSTHITHIRIKHSPKRSPERKSRFPLPVWKDEKENFRKRDVKVSDLARNKNASLPLAFFVLSREAYLN